MSRPTLTRLVGEAEPFLRDRFGRLPWHRPSARDETFADLLGREHVDAFVTSHGLRAPAFRMVRDGDTLPVGSVTRHARIGSRPVADLLDVAAVHAAFAEGATLVLQGLHRWWEPVTQLCWALEAELTHPVQANAYLTPPGAQGLDFHVDPHDVFAVQIDGTKRWVVDLPDGQRWELTLRPGDVLYLPAGTRHAAQTHDGPSLHLTLGVRTTSVGSAVRRAVEVALTEAGPSGPLPAGWADDPAAHRAALADQLETLASQLRASAKDAADTALQQLAQEFWSHRTPDRRGALLDLLDLHQLDDHTPLRARAEVVRSLHLEHDAVRLELTDRTLRFPTGLHEVLEWTLNGTRFVPGDLDALIDQPSRQVLCERLVREGVLRIARDAAGVAG